ncbi:hypothetical protein [Pseudomonas fulva]|uniref:hypothetical protein n=1 Tax=Pseudomonas fulva TaxID=47880 RepID=UPI0034CD9258
MPQGLQVFDAAGQVVIDTSTIVGLLIGRIDVAENQLSGSIYNPKLTNGRPFVVPFIGMMKSPVGFGDGRNDLITSSQVSFGVSGNTLTWIRPPRSPQETSSPAGTIYYGIYSGA